jgi:hypothetical protein
MKMKTLLGVYLFTAFAQQGCSHKTTQVQKPTETFPGIWIKNAECKTTQIQDTIPVAFFNTADASIESTVTFSQLGDVWIILQHDGQEPKAWKMDDVHFDATLLQSIKKQGSGTVITVTISSEVGEKPKWANQGLIL